MTISRIHTYASVASWQTIPVKSLPKVLLSLLPDTFDTKTAIAVGKELQNISERTVMNYLRELCHSRLLKKSKAGHYEKMVYESGKYSINENEPSTQNCNE